MHIKQKNFSQNRTKEGQQGMWNYEYTVPENKKVRLIVHTDCKNDIAGNLFSCL